MYNYEIGMKVVCVSNKDLQGSADRLTVDRIYTIRGISFCCSLNLDIGNTLDGRYHGQTCPLCDEYLTTSNRADWFDAKRFVPLSHYTRQEELVQELLKEEKIEV